MGQLSRRGFLRGGTGVLAGVSLGGLLAACGGQTGGGGGAASGALRYSWWGSDAINEAMVAGVDLVNANVGGVRLTGEFTAFDTYLEKLSTQVVAGNQPDLFEMPLPALREYAENGALLDLGALGALDLSTYGTAAVDVGKVGGTQVGVPYGIAAQTAFVDVAAFEAAGVALRDAPWTWAQFAEDTKAISDASEDGFYGTGDHGGYDTFLEVYLRQRGAELFTADGLGFGPDDLAAWLTYWEELRASGAATPADVTAEGGVGLNDSPMVRGLAAVRFGGINIYGAFDGLMETPVDFTSYPVGDDGSTGQYPRPAAYLCASANTADPEGVGEAMNYLLNDVEAREPLGLLLGVPASSDVADALVDSGDETTRRVVEYARTVTEGATAPEPAPVGANTIRDLLQRANQEVGFAEATVDQAVDEFFTEAERAFGA